MIEEINGVFYMKDNTEKEPASREKTDATFPAYLALDLGAGSGRAITGQLVDGKIVLDEVSRFENKPVDLNGTLYWDFLSLFDHIKQGIALSQRKGYDLCGIGVDTWGVDFGWLDKSGKLISNPVTYRDRRTEGMLQKAAGIVPKEEMYRISGIQQMEINTIYQLLSQVERKDPMLHWADKLLFVPDLINYFLTGKAANEYTIASTSQLLNVQTKRWEKPLFDSLELPVHCMGEIVLPGEVLGKLLPSVAEETEAKHARVFAVGSHDTASAIGAIPAEGDNWAFLSCGTWSLLGVSLDKPVLTEEALNHDFTNEAGVNGEILFMRNITGLWLLQRLMSEWEKQDGNKPSYDELLEEAQKAKPFRSVVDSDDSIFVNPLKMTVAIQEYCKRTRQEPLSTRGEFVRCVLESLALKYRSVMEKLEKTAGKSIDRLYVVGGGGQNRLLCQFIANALNMEVVTGLTEATAIGNIVQQAIADGSIGNWEAGRRIIGNSFCFEHFKPENIEDWNMAMQQKQYLFG